ncbi:MAG: chaperone modulator CbpM [Polaromonas sp.]|nr:chaperone modulator CbpM [Polaromonas sp.]
MKAGDTPRDTPAAPQGGATATAGSVSLRQLARLSGLDSAELLELMDYGVLTPTPSGSGGELFAMKYIPVLQQAQRLRSDLALDTHAFALSVMLCGRIVDLEAELRDLKAELRHQRTESATSH